MHERLQTAGARFRDETAATTSSVEVDELLPGGAARRKSGVLVVAAAAVVLLVVGLALGLRGSHRPVAPSADHAGLVGNVWLVSPNVRPSTAALYISQSGHLVADDECRVIGGLARIAGSRLTIADVSVRPKPCTDQYGAGFYEQGTRVLRGSASFRIDNGGLTISRAGIGSLHFVLAQAPIPPPSLDIPTPTGTDWVAPDGSVLRIDPTTGQLSGGWCGGRAVVSGPAVRFTDCRHTGRASYDALVAGGSLTLTAAAPHVPPRLAFRWRPADASVIEPASLTGRTWHLESVAGAPASSGSLRISNRTAVVDDGCTTYRRAVKVARGSFTIAGGGPANACNDQAATADSFVFNDPATWMVRNGRLIVYGGGSQTLALVYGSAAPTAPQQNPAALLAHPWQVVTIRAGSGRYAQGAPTADPATLTFTDSGYRLAHTCYYLDGLAQRGPHTIRFGKRKLVDHSCPRPQYYAAAKQAAQAVDAMLAGDVRWSINGSELTLSGHEGTLVLRPVDTGSPALLGRWTLRSIVPNAGSTTPDFPTAPVVFTFTSRAAAAGSTMATTVAYSDNRIRFDQPWSDNFSLNVGEPELSASTGRFVYGSLLQGALSYAVSGNSLIIVKAGVGQANFTRLR
jgi:heat shock protein HslJ